MLENFTDAFLMWINGPNATDTIHSQVTDEKRHHRFCPSCDNLEKAEKREMCVMGRKIEEESSQAKVRFAVMVLRFFCSDTQLRQRER